MACLRLGVSGGRTWRLLARAKPSLSLCRMCTRKPAWQWQPAVLVPPLPPPSFPLLSSLLSRNERMRLLSPLHFKPSRQLTPRRSVEQTDGRGRTATADMALNTVVATVHLLARGSRGVTAMWLRPFVRGRRRHRRLTLRGKSSQSVI